jgi:hypothetical protein
MKQEENHKLANKVFRNIRNNRQNYIDKLIL